ncbi:MAG: tRNA lysidine(34) synthetase TilS [Nannocystaceae bacterium]|nr:tRNA lysidine(34) synthetase TilS [bacterium]
MPPRHPDIAHALGLVRAALKQARTHDAVPKGQPYGLVVACSGGRDSVALLGLLALIADRDRLDLTVAHVDHGLRSSSEDDAAHVQALANRLGVRHVACRLQLGTKAAGVPARARAGRHDALESMRVAASARRIALAHTATDQAETMLLHLCRGAGLRGLGGMRAVEPDRPVVRPLLQLPRADTATLCARLGMAFVDDPTNDDDAHPRIRIRRDVLPALSEVRGGVEEALGAAARAARDAEDALRIWAEGERAQRSREAGGLDLSTWGGLPRAVRLRVLQAVVVDAGVAVDAIGRRTLDAIDRGVLAGGRKAWALCSGARVSTDGRTLQIHVSGRVRTPPTEPT